jgi:hypothetical protein
MNYYTEVIHDPITGKEDTRDTWKVPSVEKENK